MVLFPLMALVSMVPAASAGIVFTAEGGRYELRAEDAKVADVLREIQRVTGIPIAVDETDESTVTVKAAGSSLERVLSEVSQGYAIVYGQNPDTHGYVIERVVAAGKGDAVSAALEQGELTQQEVVRRIVERSKAVKQVHQKTVMKTVMMGTSFTMDGEMWSDGDKFRMESTVPPNQKQIIVSDGKVTYTYMPMMKLVQSMDMARIQAALGENAPKEMTKPGNQSNPLHGLDPDTLTYYGVETVNGEDVYVLEGTMGAEAQMMKQVTPFAPDGLKCWVSVADGLPRKMTFLGADGQEMMSQEFVDVVVNQAPDPGLFVFEPPADAQVVDMTESVIAMMSTMQKPSLPAP